MSSTSRLLPTLALAAGAALLAGCSSSEPAVPSDAAATTEGSASTSAGPTEGTLQEVLDREGLTGLDGKAAVDKLDAQPRDERPEDLAASVRPDELVYSTPDGEETSVPLPEDEFYVSFAPYAQQTHDCTYHALTGCVGEYFGEPAKVTVVDGEGTTLVDEEMTTFDNGFIGVWLPRDIEGGTLSVEIDGKSGSVPLGTTDEDPTCVTTLQVA